MASMPRLDLTQHPMTASELLAIRGTPEFDVEYRRQLAVIAEHQRQTANLEANELMDWNVPGWTYDAEL